MGVVRWGGVGRENREVESGREGVTENGVLRGLVFWTLTTQLSVCVLSLIHI